MYLKVTLFCLLNVFGKSQGQTGGGTNTTRPHIIFVLADDLGYNDVGFHGSNQIPTPNIDALALSGLILDNYYVAPICTPSRSALMTGKHPIHTGMQHTVLFGAEPRGLPLNEVLLPQYLFNLGYRTHLVGKWHLGSWRRVYTPLYRGFESHVGFWTGRIDYYDHTSEEHGSWGFDIRRGMEVAYELFGKYITDVYTEEAVKVINKHNSSEPLFLMVSHSAVHSGNPYTPLRAPDELVNSFNNISDPQRRKFAGMLSKLDHSMGEVVKALHKKGLLENSIIVFSTDNGGPAAGFNDNAASNYPLRGVKNTLWEGGVKGAGFLWSPLLERKTRLATQRMHISDWLPTLYSAARGNPKDLHKMDGIDLWEALSKDMASPRKDVLHNIDDIYGSASLTRDEWKLHKGTNYNGQWDSWYGPSGREGDYSIRNTVDSVAGKCIARMGLMPALSKMDELRKNATLQCDTTPPAVPCYPLLEPCLFNITADPCEKHNRAEEYPHIVQDLLFKLAEYNKTAVRPSNLPEDPRGDPKLWNHVYTNFGDYTPNVTKL